MNANTRGWIGRTGLALALGGLLLVPVRAGAQPTYDTGDARPHRGCPRHDGYGRQGGPRGERGYGPRFEGGPRGERGFDRRPPRFEDHDTDGDGVLSPAEAEGIPPVEHLGFDALDENNDGYLSREELPPPPGRGGHRPPPFEDDDTDGDGVLSPAEAEGIPPVERFGFEALDENGDGYLTRDEMPRPPRPRGEEGPDAERDDAPPGPPRGERGPRSGVEQDGNRDEAPNPLRYGRPGAY